MELSAAGEGRGFPASQEIPRILWNSRVYCPVQNSLSPVPNLSQINAVHARGFFHFSSAFRSIHFYGMKHVVSELCG